MRLPLFRCTGEECGITIMPYRDPADGVQIGDAYHVRESHQQFGDNAHECGGTMVCVGFVEVWATAPVRSTSLSDLLWRYAAEFHKAGGVPSAESDRARKALDDFLERERSK